MLDDLRNEIEVINSIYGDNTFSTASNPSLPEDHLLVVPQYAVILRLWIPEQYPSACLEITSLEGVGPSSRKGYGTHVVQIAREVLQRVFVAGQVCVFDLLQELEQSLNEESARAADQTRATQALEDEKVSDATMSQEKGDHSGVSINPPQWAISNTVTEKKSVFLARACAVESTAEAQRAITHLLSTDKRAGKATHNISAYRIRTLVGGNEVVYQDCDDDGEDAAGGRLLRLLQMMEAWNVLVVVSRWYGGVKLGPARFGIINGVAREVVVAGRFTKDSQSHQ
ncbi:MAG: hypothetical protein L6R40_003807 [Gallowayella cf. fulva]|nr:MAG: hypothetical protein L6R40_003807 [Xanthomendoza cf. fulva]